MKKLTFDIMVGDKFYCTMHMPITIDAIDGYDGEQPIINGEKIKDWVLKKCPTLKYDKLKFVFNMNDFAYTLHLEPANQKRKGRFNKGNVPWNKGLSWDEQGIPKEQQEKRKRKFHEGALKATRTHKTPKNSHPVIQIDEDGNRLHWYASSEVAARKLGLQGRNIRHVCDGKRNHCGGFRWCWDELFLT